MSDNKNYAGFGRRIGAVVYDSFLVIALLMLAGAIVFALRGGQAPPTNASWYSIYLAAVVVGFYLSFWTHGGQTLGMRAWRLKLVSDSNQRVSIQQALLRLLGSIISLAACGLGYFWLIVGEEHRTWHGRLSKTRVIVLSKKEARA